MTDRLAIVKLPNCYALRFVSGPGQARVLSLFDTDTLPLPFTLDEELGPVVASVHANHPRAIIELNFEELAR